MERMQSARESTRRQAGKKLSIKRKSNEILLQRCGTYFSYNIVYSVIFRNGLGGSKIIGLYASVFFLLMCKILRQRAIPRVLICQTTKYPPIQNDVSSEYGKKPILAEATFLRCAAAPDHADGPERRRQSTMFRLIMGDLPTEQGNVIVEDGLTKAISKQVIPRDQLDSTVLEFFTSAFPGKKIYDIEPRIKKVLEVVNLVAPLDPDRQKLFRRPAGAASACARAHSGSGHAPAR